MAFFPHLQVQGQVQSNAPFRIYPLFPINFSSNSNSNFNSCRGWSLLWCKTREVPISLVLAAPLGLPSTPIESASRSLCPPSQSLCESLESDAIPKIQDNFNYNDSYNKKEKEKKKKRKPRPSFNDLTMQRWSLHLSSQRDSLPWQTRDSPPPPPPPPPHPSSLHDLNKRGTHTFKFPNLGNKSKPQIEVGFGEDTSDVAFASSFPSQNQTTSHKEMQADPEPQIEVELSEDTSYVAVASPFPSQTQTTSHEEMEVNSYPSQTCPSSGNTHQIQIAGIDKTLSDMPTAIRVSVLLRDTGSASVTPSAKSIPILSDKSFAEPTMSCIVLPWERERKRATDTRDQNQNELSRKKSNTELAERTIPELELQRLRDAALRMKERIRVGPAGVTEAIVQAIHDKWKEEEVVKLRFEGPPSLNMKRTHEVLEVHIFLTSENCVFVKKIKK